MERGFAIKWFEVLDSTNDELLRHIPDYDNLSVVAAVSQTAGRGQRGNRWLSRPGENLTFSLLLKPENLPAAGLMAVTCLATLAVRGWLRDLEIPAVVKWPNDIYAGSRKICGMLIESGLSDGRVGWSVVGIGLNVNQVRFPGELVNPTSVRRLTGKRLDIREALPSLLSRFDPSLLETPESRAALLDAYQEDLFQKGRLCPYRDLQTGEEFLGTIKGVTPGGHLLMDVDGTERPFDFKQVGYIL